MTFATPTPNDMIFQFQQKLDPREQHPSVNKDWIILRIKYASTACVKVGLNGEEILPMEIRSDSSEVSLLALTSICGANKYYPSEQAIDVVITSNPECRPRVTLTNAIFLTAKFTIDIDAFFAADGRTKFIDRMAALLGIEDRSRIKVVGIYRGSVEVESYITSSFNSSSPDSNGTT